MYRPEKLSCADVFILLDWVTEQRGLDRSWLERPEFADKVFKSTKTHLPKLEINWSPEKEKRFSDLLKKKWKEAFKQRNCSVFEDVTKEVKEPDLAGNFLAKIILEAVDPHTTFFSRSEFEDFYEGLSGTSSGFGVMVLKNKSNLIIEQIVKNSPAQRAGLRTGDEIIAINSQPVRNLSDQDYHLLLRQPKVELTIASSKGEFRTVLKQAADVYSDELVSLKMRKSAAGKRIAWIKLPSFYGRGGFQLGNEKQERSSSDDIYRYLISLNTKSSDHMGLVLDLRGNPGGYLDEAIRVAGFFLGQQKVVSIQSPKERKTLFPNTGLEAIYTKPLIVVVDENTASSAEVVVAALKDYKRAIIVGSQRTYGKGTVQRLIALDDPFLDLNLSNNQGYLKLTTSQFFSPNGISPEGTGVKSDIIISVNNEREQKTKVEAIFDEIELNDFVPLFLHHRVPSQLDE